MQGFGCVLGLGLMVFGAFSPAFGLEVAPDPRTSPVQLVTDSPKVACEQITLNRDLNIYKDPSLFLSIAGLLYADPERGREALWEETPLLTTVRGTFQFMRVPPMREFRGFGEIAMIYERIEPRLKPQAQDARDKKKKPGLNQAPLIQLIKICGDEHAAYKDTLGFVLASDLSDAQKAPDSEDGSLPPSTVGNPIPKLKY